MANFRYSARDGDGNDVVGQIEAEDLDAARQQLSQQGLDVSDLAPDDEAAEPLSREEAEEVTQHVAQLSAANLPLSPGLRAAAEECTNRRVGRALVVIAGQLDEGRTLQDVLETSDGWFPPYVRGLVSAAARSGQLADALSELVKHHREVRSLRRGVWSAFTYPILVSCLATVILLFIVVYVVGAHQKLFDEFQLDLPQMTQVLFWWRDVGLFILAGLLVAAVFACLILRVSMGKAAWCRFVAGIPVFGRLWYWSGAAEWAGLMSVLVKNEVPMPEALRLAADGVSDAYVRKISHAMAEGVSRGRPVSQLLSSRNSLCASLGPLVRWGEETGALGEAFDTGRDLLDRRVRTRTLLLQTVLPPFLFIAIGSSVLFIVGALFIPLIALINGLS